MIALRNDVEIEEQVAQTVSIDRPDPRESDPLSIKMDEPRVPTIATARMQRLDDGGLDTPIPDAQPGLRPDPDFVADSLGEDWK